MILVLGATGTTGAPLVRELVELGAPVRAFTRSESAASAVRSLGAEAEVGDLADPVALTSALRGVERMYLCTPWSEHQAEWERNAIAAAEQAGVYHCVKLGGLGQSPSSPCRFARLHAETTEMLHGSSLRWTVLMPSAYMQNRDLFPHISAAFVDAHDVAAVAARALTEEGHESCSYTLTGPSVVEIGTTAAPPPPPSEWVEDGIDELRKLYATGFAATVTGDVESVLGRPPRGLADLGGT